MNGRPMCRRCGGFPSHGLQGPACACSDGGVWDAKMGPGAADQVPFVSPFPLDMPSPFADGEVIASLVPERPDSFDVAMAKVEELREARRDSLARRDRAEWDCFFHFACENSLFKRQAE